MRMKRSIGVGIGVGIDVGIGVEYIRGLVGMGSSSGLVGVG